MSTMSRTALPFDETPFRKQAVALVEKTIKRKIQLVIIDRAECDWGNLLLRRIVNSSGESSFELVVDLKEATEHAVFPVEAKIVADDIWAGGTGLIAAVESSLDGLALIAQQKPAIFAILEVLEIARTTDIAAKLTGAKKPRRL